MSLPPACRRITKEERTIATQALLNQAIEEPFFAVYDESFFDIVGSKPSITLIAEKHYAFAHEAPVYIPDQDAVYFTRNAFGAGRGSSTVPITITKASRQSDHGWTLEELSTKVSMGNGGINYKDGILFCAQGSKIEPGGIVLMEAQSPYATRTLVDGYHGRRFNSVNDVVTHTDGSVWFTDPTYGYEQGFRNKPQLPCQVYRFEPDTGDLRVIADQFGRPNGLCFSPDEQTMYITDTDHIHGDGADPQRVGSIYAFDVITRHASHFLANRRVFAMADNFIPDGIKCDMKGNVYSGCGDGVNVWSPGGRLIGKIIIPNAQVANFCFTKPGEVFILNEKRVWVAHVDEHVQGALLVNLGLQQLVAS